MDQGGEQEHPPKDRLLLAQNPLTSSQLTRNIDPRLLTTSYNASGSSRTVSEPNIPLPTLFPVKVLGLEQALQPSLPQEVVPLLENVIRPNISQHDYNEIQRLNTQMVRGLGACYRCQIQKRRCAPETPCPRCDDSAQNPDQSVSLRWMGCFVLALQRYDVFKIGIGGDSLMRNCPVEEAVDSHTLPSFDFLPVRPELIWLMDSPYKVLGQFTYDSPLETTESPVIASLNFLEFFREHFGLEFTFHYCSLVNPQLTALLQSTPDLLEFWVNPADSVSTTPQYLSWNIIANRRAHCGSAVLQYLMENKLGRDPLSCKDREKGFLLFLVVVGTLITARKMRELFYITSHEEMDTRLNQLVYRLGHCMILLGREWDFLEYDGSEKELLWDVLNSPNERLTSFIRKELLDHSLT